MAQVMAQFRYVHFEAKVPASDLMIMGSVSCETLQSLTHLDWISL